MSSGSPSKWCVRFKDDSNGPSWGVRGYPVLLLIACLMVGCTSVASGHGAKPRSTGTESAAGQLPSESYQWVPALRAHGGHPSVAEVRVPLERAARTYTANSREILPQISVVVPSRALVGRGQARTAVVRAVPISPYRMGMAPLGTVASNGYSVAATSSRGRVLLRGNPGVTVSMTAGTTDASRIIVDEFWNGRWHPLATRVDKGGRFQATVTHFGTLLLVEARA